MGVMPMSGWRCLGCRRVEVKAKERYVASSRKDRLAWWAGGRCEAGLRKECISKRERRKEQEVITNSSIWR